MPTNQPMDTRAVLLWSTVNCMKLGIINDMNAGIVPPTIKSFAELHDYTDANEYGGFCIDEFADLLTEFFGGCTTDGSTPQGMLDFINEAQTIVDAWIKEEG